MARKKRSTRRVANASDTTKRNGLADALGVGQFFGGIGSNNFYGAGAGNNPNAPQVSQTNTLFGNLRWYLISNFRQPLSECYVELGLIQTIIDVPVDDALRGGIKIQSQQLDETQIKELMVSVDRDDDLQVAGQAAKWNRLYGGAGIIILVGDQDPEEPLDLTKINEHSDLEFRDCDMWELFPESQNIEGYDSTTQIEDFDYYQYYGIRLHKSRVMKMKNRKAPSFLRPRLRGWGLSEIETLVRSVNQYLKATDLVFSCLDEFKVDVFKFKDLVNTLLSPQGEQKVRERVAIASASKNYQNGLVLDSEDDWDHKQISFAGIAETMQGIRMQVAADMHFPITKLFGTSASAGLGNTDQNDMENYNAMVESSIRNKLKYHLLRMMEIKCQYLFGFIPDDLELEFQPLRVLTATDEETVKTSQFARVLQSKQMGEIDSQSFADALNKAHLLPVQIEAALKLFTDDDAAMNPENPNQPKDTENPGSDRKDEQSPKQQEYE